MPIPALDEHGVLPVGVYDCTLDEIKRALGTFEGSDRRPKLFEKFQQFVAEARAAKCGRSLLIDGSFVTATAEPNDVDLVLVLPLTHDLTTDLPPA